MRQASLFLSHGSPMIVVNGIPAARFLKDYAKELERPRAILMVTAHWETPAPALSSGAAPEMIYDFFGFPEALYQITYPAPGDPDLAARAADLLEAAGHEVTQDPRRGFDHGAWTPLYLLYPAADIPVVQLSVQPGKSPAYHFALGQTLSPLRDEGVLIAASGNITHNLGEWRTHRHLPEEQAPDWVTAFSEWAAAAVESGDSERLLDLDKAPQARRNHPTLEHLLPFYVAAGAGAGETGRRIHASIDAGVLAMDAYRWG